MRLTHLTAALAAILLVPSIAAAQSVQVNNNTSGLTMNVSAFNQADIVMIQPCSTNTIASGIGAVFEKSGPCGAYGELKIRVNTFKFGSNEPSCWYYNVPWGSRRTITGTDSGVTCGQ